MPYYRFLVTGDPDVDLGQLESETGLRCTPLGSRALLDGDLVDRAALHGVLSRVQALGLDLLEIQRVTMPSRLVTTP